MSVQESGNRAHGPGRERIVADSAWVEELKAERARLGIDRWDEVWDGELHMNPPPSDEHADLEFALVEFLRPLLRRRALGHLTRLAARAPGSRDKNYRVPDLMVVSEARRDRISGCWLEGAPDFAIEIYSPGDETYQKLDFYAAQGMTELVVIHRDTRAAELYRLDGGRLTPVAPRPDGALVADTIGVGFRQVREGALEVFDARDSASRMEI